MATRMDGDFAPVKPGLALSPAEDKTPFPEQPHAGTRHRGVEKLAAVGFDFRERFVHAHHRTIRPVRGHGLDHIGDRENAHLGKDDCVR